MERYVTIDTNLGITKATPFFQKGINNPSN